MSPAMPPGQALCGNDDGARRIAHALPLVPVDCRFTPEFRFAINLYIRGTSA
jgi:hypothetical protein